MAFFAFLRFCQSCKSEDSKKVGEYIYNKLFSGLNNIRKSHIYEEDSTIIEDESEIFDENDHKNVINGYDQIPLLVSSKEPEPNKQRRINNENTTNNIEGINIAGSGTYNIENALTAAKENSPQFLNTATRQKTKRPFLKRGQGKNCLIKKPVENKSKKKLDKKSNKSTIPSNSVNRNEISKKTSKNVIKPSEAKFRRQSLKKYFLNKKNN